MLVDYTKKWFQVPEERHVGRIHKKIESKFRRNDMLVELTKKRVQVPEERHVGRTHKKKSPSSGGTTCW